MVNSVGGQTNALDHLATEDKPLSRNSKHNLFGSLNFLTSNGAFIVFFVSNFRQLGISYGELLYVLVVRRNRSVMIYKVEIF